MPESRLAELIAAGRWQEAARILEALGRTREAIDAYGHAGRPKEAERLRAGLIRSRPGAPGSPLFRARALAERGQPGPALSSLVTLRPEQPEYKAACRLAIQVAEGADVLDFDLDHFLGPFVLGQGALAHEPADLPALDRLGELYARHDMKESAGSAWRAVLQAAPGWGDVSRKLAALEAPPPAGRASFEELLASELSFRPTARRSDGPTPRTRLPDLPDLPSLDSLEELTHGEAPERTPSRARSPGSPPPAERSPAERRTTAAFDDVTQTADLHLPPAGPVAPRPIAPPPVAEAPLEPASLEVGDLVADRYEVQGLLGRGGMGVVLHVTDTMLGEDVAMKLVYREQGVREEDKERFKSEMRICRRLVHPSVVRVFEFGMWRGSLYLTMELLAGTDLDAVLKTRREPLPVVQALRLLMQACDGLGAAHAMGVVHRDVKPQNLFVLEDGQTLKVMDFGIAQPRTVDRTLTQTGAIVGSPAYLAPERLRGDPAIPSSDLYALGCVAYQMLTGVHPFRATELAALFVQHLQTPPTPPRRLNPALPVDVERLVLRLLEKEPSRRFGTANELRRALTMAWRAVLDPPR